MAQITPQDMVNWFRAKSKEFTQMADSLESTFNLTTGTPAIGITRTRREPQGEALPAKEEAPTTITAESVKWRMDGKAKRLGQLAGACGVTEQALLAIIQEPGSGLELATRGWVKLS